MKLAYRCPGRKEPVLLNIRATDRSELARDFPQGVPVKCPDSEFNHMALPNEIFAVEDKLISVAGGAGVLLSFLAGGIFIYSNWTNVLSVDLYLLMVLAGILVIPPLIANALVKSERASISTFNRYRI